MAFKDDVRKAVMAVADGLPALERSIVVNDTQWVIQDAPTPEQYAAAKAGPGTVMFALYSNPPAKIVLFEKIIRLNHYPVQDTVAHEIQHRLGYDHSMDEFTFGCGVNVGDLMQPASAAGASDNCPPCRIHEVLASAERLAWGLASYSRGKPGVPRGLGGTVPLIRARLLQARALLPRLEPLLPDRTGQIRSLRGLVGRAFVAYAGTVDAASAARAYREVHRAWQASYELAWAYFVLNPPPAPACVQPRRWAVVEAPGTG